jgi:hypothetical protein
MVDAPLDDEVDGVPDGVAEGVVDGVVVATFDGEAVVGRVVAVLACVVGAGLAGDELEVADPDGEPSDGDGSEEPVVVRSVQPAAVSTTIAPNPASSRRTGLVRDVSGR